MKKRENIWKDALSCYIAVFQLIYSKFYQILGRFFQLDFFTSLSDAKMFKNISKHIFHIKCTSHNLGKMRKTLAQVL